MTTYLCRVERDCCAVLNESTGRWYVQRFGKAFLDVHGLKEGDEFRLEWVAKVEKVEKVSC